MRAKLIVKLFILLLVTIYSNSMTMKIKMLRNSTTSCKEASDCSECTSSENFKSCSNSICYCCNLDPKCVIQR